MNERITVTLPGELVRDIERFERNRSKFILSAVRHELQLREREKLRRSLRNPHPESHANAELGFEEWSAGLPDDEVDDLLNTDAGQDVSWIAGEGWNEVER